MNKDKEVAHPEPPKWIVVTNMGEQGIEKVDLCIPTHFIKFIAPQFENSTLIQHPTPIVGKSVVTFMDMSRMAVAQSFDQLVNVLGAVRMTETSKLN